MAKIVVDVGVYLPSNPDGKVVDIDKKSGRPLQSHAKVRISCKETVDHHRFTWLCKPGPVHGNV